MSDAACEDYKYVKGSAYLLTYKEESLLYFSNSKFHEIKKKIDIIMGNTLEEQRKKNLRSRLLKMKKK
tara:strand:- start:4728 stop:4931 length:204 start_codon:yes stop_codon:yes gene_type:complete